MVNILNFRCSLLHSQISASVNVKCSQADYFILLSHFLREKKPLSLTQQPVEINFAIHEAVLFA